MKTNEGLARFAEESVGTPYIYGTFGAILTERGLAEKSKQYPKQLSSTRVDYARKNYIGKRTTDCYGLAKRYKWTEGDSEFPSQEETPKYNSSQDITANDAYTKAKVKGPISTIPEVRGICVRYNGHFGVYVGKDAAGVQWVVEARGFDYGTVKTKLKDRPWTEWFQESDITYKTEEKKPDGTGSMLPELKKGDKNTDAVESWQTLLRHYEILDQNNEQIVIDRSFGAKTEFATKQVQKKAGLPQTGVVDSKTWTSLIT